LFPSFPSYTQFSKRIRCWTVSFSLCLSPSRPPSQSDRQAGLRCCF
jgi:hypothetical protein